MEDDVVTDYGQSVKACLLGQTSAAVMGREIVGSTAAELRAVGAAMRKMLKAGGPPPQGRWADLAVLQPVKDYKARQASTLLVFDAVEDAIAQIEAKRGEAQARALRESMSERFAGKRALGSRIAKKLMLAPIVLYRWTLSPLLGVNCRHLPTCSDYAHEAIDKNGAWKGGWLALSRFCRCHPWGSHGFDPVPDLWASITPSRRGAMGGGASRVGRAGVTSPEIPLNTRGRVDQSLTCARTQE